MTDNIQQYLESTISRCLEDTMTAVTSVPQEALENMETAAAVMSLSLPDNKIICLGSSLCQPLCSIFSRVQIVAHGIIGYVSMPTGAKCVRDLFRAYQTADV